MQSKDVSCQVDYWDFLRPELRFQPKQETNSEIMSQVKVYMASELSWGINYNKS